MYNDKYIKTRVKIYNDRVYTNFQHNKIPKDNEYCACLSVILLDSIFDSIQIKNIIHKCFCSSVNIP